MGTVRNGGSHYSHTRDSADKSARSSADKAGLLLLLPEPVVGENRKVVDINYFVSVKVFA